MFPMRRKTLVVMSLMRRKTLMVMSLKRRKALAVIPTLVSIHIRVLLLRLVNGRRLFRMSSGLRKMLVTTE
jgi:hypothetical protein